jgi:phosphoribosyl 1,2-cyclic phosphate phosphodiesterase
VRAVDAVLYTHEHADHIHGIDDLRPLFIRQKRRVDVYVDRNTAKTLHERFAYCFSAPPGSEYPPILTEHALSAGQALTIDGAGGPINVWPFLQDHGDISSLGFRFGDVAYSVDLNDIPSVSLDALRGLDVWILDALRHMPHPSHFSLSDALQWIGRIKPRRAILTNLHSDLDYAELKASLPAHVEPAYDGIQFTAD